MEALLMHLAAAMVLTWTATMLLLKLLVKLLELLLRLLLTMAELTPLRTVLLTLQLRLGVRALATGSLLTYLWPQRDCAAKTAPRKAKNAASCAVSLRLAAAAAVAIHSVAEQYLMKPELLPEALLQHTMGLQAVQGSA